MQLRIKEQLGTDHDSLELNIKGAWLDIIFYT